MSEDTPQHPREITLELIFRQGQRILGELGHIREKQDEIVTRLARVERGRAIMALVPIDAVYIYAVYNEPRAARFRGPL
jgi:hypothetical protein